VLVIAVGFAVGVWIRAVVAAWLRRSATGTATGVDDLVLDAVRGPVVLWGTLVGVHAATLLWDLSPGASRLVQRVVVALVIASVSWVGARLAAILVERKLVRSTGLFPSASLIRNAVQSSVLVVGALVLLQTIGISVTPIITALGVGGLAVALALQDTLANLFAGIRVLAAGKIRPGDFVELDSGQRGFVEDISWNQTTIRQLPNLLTVVPNARLAAAIVTNCSLPDPESAVLVPVGVSYASDLARVERVTVDVAREVMREVEGGVPGFEPFIRYNAFGDSSIAFTVILRGREFTSQYLVKHEFIKRLHARYAREGIEIPFPQRTLHFDQSAAAAAARGS
jgi:small-conductance mechanosensitive channel